MPEVFDLLFCDLGYVAEVRNIRIVSSKNCARCRFNLSGSYAFPAEMMPCEGCTLKAAEQGEIPHSGLVPSRKTFGTPHAARNMAGVGILFSVSSWLRTR